MVESTIGSVPAQRPAEVEEILTTLKRYNQDVIVDLEEYVTRQCQENFVDVEANLALLKLYELSPINPDADVTVVQERENSIINVLAKGLLNFVGTDLSLYMHLLPSYTLVVDSDVDSLSESVQALLELYELLDAGNFVKFWEVYNAGYDKLYSDMFADLNNFETLIRIAIAEAVAFVFTELRLDILGKYLDLSAEKTAEFLKENASSLKNVSVDEASGTMKVSGGESLVVKPNVTHEKVKFEQLNVILKKAF